MNRDTWYAAPPTATFVRPQLQALADPVQRAHRFEALRQEIAQVHLGGAALPQVAVPGGAP